MKLAHVFKFNTNHEPAGSNKGGQFAKASGSRNPLFDTKEFKAWFGNSKIVDAKGNPLVVYHGTKREFTEFQPKYGDGLSFFTLNPQFASSWVNGTGGLREPPAGTEEEYQRMKAIANQITQDMMTPSSQYDFNTPEGKALFSKEYEAVKVEIQRQTGFRSPTEFENVAGTTVMPVYLSIQKPFDATKDYAVVEAYLRTQENGMSELVDKGYHKSGNWVIYENKNVINFLKEKGYDGIWINETTNGVQDTIAPFSSEQIKSAIGNNGKFSPKSKNILKFETVLKYNPNHSKENGEFIAALHSSTSENPFDYHERILNNESGIEASIFDGNIHISSIRSFNKGQGQGSRALQHILSIADKTKATLTLEPSAYGTDKKSLTTDQLEAWYSRHGFAYDDNLMTWARHPKTLKFENIIKFNQSHDKLGKFAASNGAKAHTATPEFKAWFGGSKVVNKDGSPLVAFHPNQLKSAIGNNGKFDPKNNNITKFESVLKYNTNHEPAGTPKGGEFTKGKGDKVPKYARILGQGITINDKYKFEEIANDGNPKRLPKKGETFVVFRVGSTEAGGLAGRNGADSTGLADFLDSALDYESPVGGNNPLTAIHAYEVTLTHNATDQYHGQISGFNRAGADMSKQKVGVRNQWGGRNFSFSPTGYGYTEKHVGSIPLPVDGSIREAIGSKTIYAAAAEIEKQFARKLGARHLQVLKYNKNHDKLGLFSHADSTSSSNEPNMEAEFKTAGWDKIAEHMASVNVTMNAPYGNHDYKPLMSYSYPPSKYTTGEEADRIRMMLFETYNVRKQLQADFGIPHEGNPLNISLSQAFVDSGATGKGMISLPDMALATKTLSVDNLNAIVRRTKADEFVHIASYATVTALMDKGDTNGAMKDYVQSLVRHEYAHTITNSDILNTAFKVGDQNTDRTSIDKPNLIPIARAVSMYATTTLREFAAEVFAKYTNPHYVKGSMPKDMESLAKKMIKSTK